VKNDNEREPRYMAIVTELGKALGPGIHHVNVLHDKWCDLLKGKGPCNCNPEVESAKDFQ
jgi:hypothetical protein